MPTGTRKESSSTGIGCLPSFLIIIVATILIIIIVAYFNEASKEKHRIELQKDAAQREERALSRFINAIEQHYQELRTFYDNKDFNQAARVFELFKEYQKSAWNPYTAIGSISYACIFAKILYSFGLPQTLVVQICEGLGTRGRYLVPFLKPSPKEPKEIPY